jgi:hypothetical protein
LTCCSLLLVLASCGPNRIGTIPSGTPDHGNGTPAVILTPTQPVLKAPPTATGTNYTFVRQNQLWLALNGVNPVQVTHFVYSNTPDVFWHEPLWSPGDHYIAFILAARQVGQGGGGCPAPDFGANGGLYLLNTATRQFAPITLLSGNTNTSAKANTLLNDYWQYAFWEDATHLLAWYNGPAGKTSSTAGLYRYNLNTQTLTQVIPLSVLGVTTLFSAQAGLPLLLSMRYSSEQLFYQVIVNPFEQHSTFVIYSHPVTQPGVASQKVLETGSESWCTTQQSGPYMKPGWDISQDGEQLAVQMVSADGSSGLSSIQVHNLNNGSPTQLFTQAPAQLFGYDLSLTWGPDSQSVVVTTPDIPGQIASAGPYSATLANPTAVQQYKPVLGGQVAWRSDSSAFALTPPLTPGVTTTPDVYLFNTGDVQGRVLLTNAQNFVWG